MLSLHQVRYGGMKTLLCIIAMVTGVFAFCMSCYASQYAIRTVELELNKLGTTVVIATHSDKIIHDFAYPRLHLQNKGLHIYYPSDTSMLRGIND